MREIKFRFWTKTNKVMADNLSLERISRTGFSEKSVFNPNRKGVVTMQYTGLKDKNGKEIYEGDIVKDGVGNIDVIVWHPAGYFAIQRNREDHTWIEGQRIEVIGNIYENPEMLKGGEK